MHEHVNYSSYKNYASSSKTFIQYEYMTYIDMDQEINWQIFGMEAIYVWGSSHFKTDLLQIFPEVQSTSQRLDYWDYWPPSSWIC